MAPHGRRLAVQVRRATGLAANTNNCSYRDEKPVNALEVEIKDLRPATDRSDRLAAIMANVAENKESLPDDVQKQLSAILLAMRDAPSTVKSGSTPDPAAAPTVKSGSTPAAAPTGKPAAASTFNSRSTPAASLATTGDITCAGRELRARGNWLVLSISLLRLPRYQVPADMCTKASAVRHTRHGRHAAAATKKPPAECSSGSWPWPWPWSWQQRARSRTRTRGQRS
jgi:hypothetical protein